MKNCDVKYKILQVRKPYEIKEVDFRTPINELYEKQIDMDMKKLIVNKITGMMELKYNKNHISKIFDDINEADVYRIKYGGKILPVITS